MYFEKISTFCAADSNAIFGKIDLEVETSTTEGRQKGAWYSEIGFLQEILNITSQGINEGYITFEYTIPRLGKRPDVILLIQGIVFVLEFKVGEKSASKSQKNQALGYAEALKYYHYSSWNRVIVPILVATESKAKPFKFVLGANNVSQLLVCNKNNLLETIYNIIEECRNKSINKIYRNWEKEWINGQYNPNPSIIDSTLKHYNSHEVKEIKYTEADEETIVSISDFVVSEIEKIKNNNEKAIFFVTGVPGAGKTLVGLEIVAKTHKKYKSVFFSGNGPLVDVLSTVLTKDSETQEKYAKKIDHEIISKELYKPTSMVQLIHGYRKSTVDKIKDITKDGQLILKDNSKPEVEHVVIFDEAQRAWTREKLMSPGRSGRINIIQRNDSFPYSEPGFLLWSMDQHEEWSVVVCLVGGGQEINTGEAGIMEWINSLSREEFAHWKVYMPEKLIDKEYGGKELMLACNELKNKKYFNQTLHLSVSKRSIRSEKVSDFVKKMLDGDLDVAKSIYESFKNDYPIVLTRDLNKAKQWIRKKQVESMEKRPRDRAGVLISSKAFRLRPLGFEIKKVGEYKKVANWFLCDIQNTEASDFLEVALSEFFVQGLELDLTLVVWDADFRAQLDENKAFVGWQYFGGFNGVSWENNNSQQDYQLNAYRVLLTRARRGMIICVPEGTVEDATRQPEFYDGTYEYLKLIGLEVI